jgi:hypothetical protein
MFLSGMVTVYGPPPLLAVGALLVPHLAQDRLPGRIPRVVNLANDSDWPRPARSTRVASRL